MPSQQVELAETIAALRRARERDKSAPSRQPIYSTTNRGHKLFRGANHVHSGVLAYTYGPERYREKIEHAGYTRYILERNPKRYDERGNELEDSDLDEDADADAADENAYNGILIEELLCPLKHPSELATHPSLSLPYLDSALPDMVRSTEEKLQQERANLWRAKNLNRQFIGDRPWMPCGAVESNDDWDMFEPKPKRLEESGSRKRKRANGEESLHVQLDGDEALPNGENDQAHESQNESPAVLENGDLNPESAEGKDDAAADKTSEKEGAGEKTPADLEMIDAEGPAEMNGEIHTSEPVEKTDGEKDGLHNAAQNGHKEHTDATNLEEGGEASEEASPVPPPRRITRALAATNNSNAPTPPLSPTPTLTDSSTSSLYQVDQLFLLPPHISSTLARTASTSTLASGLPLEEAVETRKLLTVYIQKQEESVRGYEAVLAKLIKAKRMRDEVLETCKAEGHVGEMSDGEDWIDHQRWNLKPGELKKGKDEDDDGGEEREPAGIGGGRKGKRRRN